MNIEKVIELASGKKVMPKDGYEDLWLQAYKGNIERFHNYTEFNGQEDVKLTRKTLNMPKKASEDWANLLLNEKTDVAVDGEGNQDTTQRLMNDIHFWQKGNIGVEKTFALGNGAFVESYTADGKPKIQFVNATKMYPITIEDDVITECAFANVNSNNVTIQIYTKDNEGYYYIRTLKGEKKDKDLIMHWGEMDYDYTIETGTKIPFFQCFKPNIANNINIDSPLGISIFANAIDETKGIDLAYDGFCNEMSAGKLRAFVDKRLTHYVDGQEKPTFDNRDTFFYVYGLGEDDTKDPMKFYNPSLRTDSYFNGVNNALNLFSSKVGFGANHYRFDQNGISTATQVISENSEMFRTLKKHEIILNDVIVGALRALIYICNHFGDGTYTFVDEDNINIEVKFDDSIIEDKESQKVSDRQDVNMGVMSKAEYRSKWYAEDIETAQEAVDNITKANMANMGNFFSSQEE